MQFMNLNSIKSSNYTIFCSYYLLVLNDIAKIIKYLRLGIFNSSLCL